MHVGDPERSVSLLLVGAEQALQLRHALGGEVLVDIVL
jgi:hypothetical protein